MDTAGPRRKRPAAGCVLALLLGMMRLGVGAAFAQDTSPQPNVTPPQDIASPDDVDNDAESPDLLLPINVQGSWSGSITDDSLGGGSFSITITQHNYRLSGGWT